MPETSAERAIEEEIVTDFNDKMSYGAYLQLESHPEAHELLSTLLDMPSVYDEFLRYLARHGHSMSGTSGGTVP